MDAEAIKKCPLCGSSNIQIKVDLAIDGRRNRHMYCTECDSEYYTPEQAKSYQPPTKK